MPEITSAGFVTRNIIEYLTTDKGIRQYRCNTLQNPLAYHDGTQLRPVSITDVADTFSARGDGIYLRDKSIVSVGIKKADDAYKFMGLRPDEKQDGSEQLEFSLESIEVNGKRQIIDLSTKTAFSPLSHTLGPLVVQSRRQGTRICLPVSNADEGFRFALRMHLTGLTVTYRPDLDEYWIYNEAGQFRFRLRTPLLLDPATGEPLRYEDEPGRYDGLVRHSLTKIADGEYLYVKEPTEAFGKAILPERFLVDVNVVYSNVTDGHVVNTVGSPWNWVNLHNAATGTAAYDQASSPRCIGITGSSRILRRAFFDYALTDLSGTVSACSENIYGNVNGDAYGDACSQLGTQALPPGINDFDSFSGTVFGTVASWTTGSNAIPYNSTGLTALQNALGSSIKTCVRDYAYDYLNSDPGGACVLSKGALFADYAGTTYDPNLYLTMAIAPTRTVSLDALIQRTGITHSSSVDALIQTSRTGSASLDALIALAGSEPVSMGALLQAVHTGTLSLDALLQITSGRPIGLDALLLAAKAGHISLDAVISLISDISVGLDAVISGATLRSLALDALLQAAKTDATSLDALLRDSGAEPVSLDALIRAVKSGDISLDALLALTGSQTVSLSALIRAVRSGAISLDALIAVSQSAHVSLDALIRAVKSGAISLDALLQIAGAEPVSLDALVAASASGAISLDALISLVGAETVGLDAVLSAVRSGTLGLDAILQLSGRDITAVLDGMIQALMSGELSIDAFIAIAGGQSVFYDACLRITQDSINGIDALIVPAGYTIAWRHQVVAPERVTTIKAPGRVTEITAPERVTTIICH